MDSLGFGKLITTPQQRDAIHVAVAPVTAAEMLRPGAFIGWADAKLGRVLASAQPVGIVDPFLADYVLRDQQFWMFLFPGTVTSLRHDWTHPAFAEKIDKVLSPEFAASEAWLKDYAVRTRPYEKDADEAYQDLLDNLRVDHLYYHGIELCCMDEVIDRDELERHAGVVLGKEIDLKDFSFSCSC